MPDPAPAPTQAALERAEAFVLREMMEQLQIPASRVQPWVNLLALAIDAAVEAERAACEAALERLAERASRGDISCSDVLFERGAIAARRGK